jgi:predicted nucleic acid-binding protein
MAYLLDTNVISEAIKPQPNERVVAWLKAERSLRSYLSVLTLGEITQGIVRSPSPRKAAHLTRWLETELVPKFQGRILAIDAAVMRTWGQVTGAALKQGKVVSYPDSLLAATAITHGLVLVTRNAKDLGVLPVQVLNPWEE